MYTGLAQLVEHRSPKPSVGSSSLSTRALIQYFTLMKIVNYIKESYNELVYKVSWPTRSELSNSAVVVMFASLVLAVLIFLIDLGFEKIMLLFYGNF